MAKKTYTLITEIISVRGHQVWTVEACRPGVRRVWGLLLVLFDSGRLMIDLFLRSRDFDDAGISRKISRL